MKRFSILIFLFFAASSMFAQLGERIYYRSPIYIEAGSGYQKYSTGDTSLSLIYFPVSVTIPVTQELSFSVSNNPFMVTRELSKGEVKVNNLSDTKIGARYIFLNRQALLNLFVSLPTGKTKLELSEFDIFTDLGLSILKYKISNLGEGTNLGAGFNYAFPLDRKNTLGIGISYNSRMEYQPINWEPIERGAVFKYDPPDEFGVNASYFGVLNENVKLGLDLFYTKYSPASINGNDVYEPGDIISFISAISVQTGTINHVLILNPRYYTENKQKRLGIWTSFKSSYQLDTEYKLSFNLFNDVTMFGLFQYRNYGKYQDNWNGRIYVMEESNLFSAGLGFNIPLLETVYLNALGKYNNGKVTMLSEMDFKGFEASLKINYAF